MDDIVLRGMAKWPNVPAVYGWLALTRRGEWLIKGEPVSNPAISAFIGRNYESDGDGQWFFQNGPQRVFVSLAYTPHVYRALNGVDGPLQLESHTGAQALILSGAWLDERGALILEADCGIGVMHDRDLDSLTGAFCDNSGRCLPESALEDLVGRVQHGQDAPLWINYRATRIKVGAISSHEVPRRFCFNPQPAPPAGCAECA